MIRNFSRVAAFCCATSFCIAHAATDITVVTTSMSTALDGQCSLPEAILAATDGKTVSDCIVGPGGAPYRVILQPGAIYNVAPRFGGSTFAYLSGSYNISIYGIVTRSFANLEIIGNGATIQRDAGAGKFRLFSVFDATVVIRDVTLKGADVRGVGYYDTGGAIDAEFATLTLDRVRFEDNTASYGGGVYAGYNTNLTVLRSSFVRNTSVGALYVDGDSPANVANSTFSNATDFVVAGLNEANISLTHNTFGGIFYATHKGSITARGNVFTSCTVDNDGATVGSFNIGPGTCGGLTNEGLAVPLEPSEPNGGPGETKGFVVPSQLQDFDASCTFVSTGTNPLFTNGARVTTDQRGVSRGSSGPCDVGAYEESGVRMNATLVPAHQGMAYSSTLTGTGGTGPYAFELVDAPDWLSVTSSGGVSSLVGLTPTSGHGTSFPIILRSEDAGGLAGFETYTVSIVAGLPGAPTLTSNSLDEATSTMTVNFTPPADDGGSPITSYVVRCTTPFQSAASATSPIVFTVPTGSNYNCAVVAINISGSGPASEGTFGMAQGFAVVTSLTRPNPAIIAPNQRAAFNITFSRPVIQVSADDFQVVATGTLTGNSIIDVTGSGTSYQVGVNTGTGGFGSLTLNFKDIDSVFDSSLVPVAGPGVGGGDFAGPTYIVASPPSVPAITGVFAGPAYGIVYVQFNGSTDNGQPVLRYDATCNPGARTASTFAPTNREIAVPITMGLDYSCTVKAVNAAGASAASAPSATVSTIPTAIMQMKAAPSSINPAKPGSTVMYVVQFNYPVTGVDVSDFQLVTTGLTGAAIKGVVGSGTDWLVTVSAGTGSGSLRIDNIDDDTIVDQTGGPLNGVGTGPGSTGETFFINNLPSAPQILGAGASDSQIAVAFDPPLSDGGLPITDYLATCQGRSGGPTVSAHGAGSPVLIPVVNGWTYDCAAVAYNSSGPGLYSSPVTVSLLLTSVAGIQRAMPDPAYAPQVTYTVTFTNPVTGVDATDFAVASTGLTGTSIVSVTGSGATYTVAVNRGTGTGTLRLDLVFDGSINDASAPLAVVGGVYTGETYTILNAPYVVSITPLGPTTTSADSIDFQVTFDPAVQGVDMSDFTLATTGVTGAFISEVFGAGRNWFVTIDTGSGSGTIRLDLVDDDSINDGSTPLGGPGAGNGDAQGPLMTIQRAGPPPLHLRRGDFDGDGNGDLVFRNTDGTVAIWQMNGLSNVGSASILGPGTNWSVAHIADFDGDGRSDIVWQNTDGTIAVYTMLGAAPPIATAQIVGAGQGWSVTQAADLDGDGKADLIFQNTDGTIAAWLMNGTGMTSGATILGAGSGWSVTKTGDFDDDGKADLLFTHTDGRVAIYLMNGLTASTTAQILDAGSGWSVSHVIDLDGDGKDDIVWHHTDGRAAAWLMNGTAMAGGGEILGAGTGWSVTHTGDFNGDGKGDLVFTHTDGRAAIYLMDGLTPATTTQILNAGGGWSVKRVIDLDGDGKTDLVFENTDGRIAVWLMNGTAMSSGGEIVGAGQGWTVSGVSQ